MQISVFEPATTAATCSKMQNNEKLPAFICNKLRRRLWHALALPTLLLLPLLLHKYEYSFCNFCIRCGCPGSCRAAVISCECCSGYWVIGCARPASQSAIQPANYSPNLRSHTHALGQYAAWQMRNNNLAFFIQTNSCI